MSAGGENDRNPAKKIEYIIDCSAPIKDKIMDAASFEKFLSEHIKVDNKLNNLNGNVVVSGSDDKISVSCTCEFSKRYLKYLTKKYLKKNSIRDYLRVIASGKNSFKVVYYNVEEEE